ncbi:capsule polysaccharide biosynthesis protein [Apiospora saccharicola]
MTQSSPYPIPAGLSPIPEEQLDLRPDAEVDHDLLHPKPVSDEKNVWLFWDTGLGRASARPPAGLPLNVASFLDVADPTVFPRAFRDGTLAGAYGAQHTSDLVRWPLLLRHGGVYVDVGLMPIGDLDRLWCETVGNDASPARGPDVRHGRGHLTNYFLASGRDNPLFLRCHRLLLELWAADGGKTTTDGMRDSPLLRGPAEVSDMLADYIIQGQAALLVMGLVDDEDGWDGPRYVHEHVWASEFMESSQLVNQFTAWDGPKAFELMSLPLPREGEAESDGQRQAREIVEGCLQRSFVFKLAHGIIIRVRGPTLGSLWRANEGSDDVPGTYAHWLRYGMLHWEQESLPERCGFNLDKPFKRGPLLRET